MGWVDLIPRAGKLYIGGLHALYQKQELFKEYGITHILSVLDFNLYEAGHFKEYKHLQIRIDDTVHENLLQHFSSTTDFITDALKQDGAVFVHCAMGKSRSAAVAVAYLMNTYGTSPAQALDQICEGRPVCSPNPGFMEQLEVYHRMLKARNEDESKRIYDEWLKQHEAGDYWSQYRKFTKL